MKKHKDESWLKEQYGEKGRLQKDIAKECGVCRKTIGYWINKFGIERKRKYKDEDWLREQYKEKVKTQYDIAEECGVSQGVIEYWVNKYAIKKKTKKEKYKDEKWLREQYATKGLSQHDIAEECGVCRSTIEYWVDRHGVKKGTKEEVAKKNPLKWSKDIAYLSGLITSDGNLYKDKRGETNNPLIAFASKDYTLITQVQQIVRRNLTINNCTPYQMQNDVWTYTFTSHRFYYFLEDMGLMPNKSLKIGKLNIPDNMFSSWLRGEIDGDGSFGVYRGYLRSMISSGSSAFLEWVSQKLKDYNLVDGKGNVYEDRDIYRLQFWEQDSKCIVNAIYKDANYYLQRKYDIVKEYIDASESC